VSAYRDTRLKIFSGNANPSLSRSICQNIGVELGEMTVTRFSDGETRLIIEENVRGCDVFVIQPTSAPVNDHLMELLIIMDALKRASASRITAVVPYFGYARQDRKTRGREPITAKLVADLISRAGAHRLLTVDLHAGQIQGFFDIPVDNLSAVPILAEFFRAKHLEGAIVVSPDPGGVARARDLADRLNVGIAIIDKSRPRPNVSEAMNVVGRVAGRCAIVVDDIMDTAGTISGGAEALVKHGAERVFACCTHPVLSGAALEKLEAAPIEEVVVTDSIALPDGSRLQKLRVLSLAPLLAQAIIRIHEDRSVSALFR